MEDMRTDFQDEIVKESGCDLIQGFYYYRPMELEQLYRLLAEQYRGKPRDTLSLVAGDIEFNKKNRLIGGFLVFV